MLSRLNKLVRVNLRIAKRTLFGALVASFGYSLYKNDFDLSSYGLVRIGRAGIAVTTMAIDYKLTQMWLKDLPEEEEKLSLLHSRNAKRLLKLAKKNGGCYIKVGQHLASLDYLLPNEYIRILSELRSNAPLSPFEDVLLVLRQDLGPKADRIVRLDPQPVGSASLAQVHKAILDDGRQVAVKVQHLRVKKNSLVDIITMDLLTKAVAATFSDFKFQWLAEEMRRNLPIELNFRSEGENADRVRRMFKHLTFLKVPEILWDFSSDRVLFMEFCEGAYITDLDYVKANAISPDDVCDKLIRLYSEMIFIHGYVHCDPHPGNLLVRKDEEGHTTITLLDHGLYTTLDEDFRQTYAKLWLGVFNKNDQMIKAAANALNVGDMHALFACMVTKRSWKAITTGIDQQRFTAQEGDEIRNSASVYIRDMISILGNVSRPMLLIFKTNDLLKSIDQALRPNSLAMDTYMPMVLCCLQAVYTNALDNCRTWRGCLTLRLQWMAAVFRFFIIQKLLAFERMLSVFSYHCFRILSLRY